MFDRHLMAEWLFLNLWDTQKLWIYELFVQKVRFPCCPQAIKVAREHLALLEHSWTVLPFSFECLTCCLMLALSSNMVRIWIIARWHFLYTNNCNSSGPLKSTEVSVFFQRAKRSNTQCGISTGIHGRAVNEVTLVILQTVCNTIERDGRVKTSLIMWILSHLKLLQSLSLPPLGREHFINASQSGCKGDYNKFERMWIREGEGDELYSASDSGDLEKIWVPPTEINFPVTCLLA